MDRQSKDDRVKKNRRKKIERNERERESENMCMRD